MHPDSILQKAKKNYPGWDISPSQGNMHPYIPTFIHTWGEFDVANPDTCMFLEGKRNLCEPGENMFNSA